MVVGELRRLGAAVINPEENDNPDENGYLHCYTQFVKASFLRKNALLGGSRDFVSHILSTFIEARSNYK